MHLHTHLIGIEDYRHIRGDNSIYPLGLCPINHIVHLLQLCIVDNRIYRKVGLNPMFVSNAVYLGHIVSRKVCRRCRAHIELPDTEIYRVCTRRNRCTKALIRAHRRHNLYICPSHTTSFYQQDSQHTPSYALYDALAHQGYQG